MDPKSLESIENILTTFETTSFEMRKTLRLLASSNHSEPKIDQKKEKNVAVDPNMESYSSKMIKPLRLRLLASSKHNKSKLDQEKEQNIDSNTKESSSKKRKKRILRSSKHEKPKNIDSSEEPSSSKIRKKRKQNKPRKVYYQRKKPIGAPDTERIASLRKRPDLTTQRKKDQLHTESEEETESESETESEEEIRYLGSRRLKYFYVGQNKKRRNSDQNTEKITSPRNEPSSTTSTEEQPATGSEKEITQRLFKDLRSKSSYTAVFYSPDPEEQKRIFSENMVRISNLSDHEGLTSLRKKLQLPIKSVMEMHAFGKYLKNADFKKNYHKLMLHCWRNYADIVFTVREIITVTCSGELWMYYTLYGRNPKFPFIKTPVYTVITEFIKSKFKIKASKITKGVDDGVRKWMLKQTEIFAQFEKNKIAEALMLESKKQDAAQQSNDVCTSNQTPKDDTANLPSEKSTHRTSDSENVAYLITADHLTSSQTSDPLASDITLDLGNSNSENVAYLITSDNSDTSTLHSENVAYLINTNHLASETSNHLASDTISNYPNSKSENVAFLIASDNSENCTSNSENVAYLITTTDGLTSDNFASDTSNHLASDLLTIDTSDLLGLDSSDRSTSISNSQNAASPPQESVLNFTQY